MRAGFDPSGGATAAGSVRDFEGDGRFDNLFAGFDIGGSAIAGGEGLRFGAHERDGRVRIVRANMNSDNSLALKTEFSKHSVGASEGGSCSGSKRFLAGGLDGGFRRGENEVLHLVGPALDRLIDQCGDTFDTRPERNDAHRLETDNLPVAFGVVINGMQAEGCRFQSFDFFPAQKFKQSLGTARHSIARLLIRHAALFNRETDFRDGCFNSFGSGSGNRKHLPLGRVMRVHRAGIGLGICEGNARGEQERKEKNFHGESDDWWKGFE